MSWTDDIHHLLTEASQHTVERAAVARQLLATARPLIARIDPGAVGIPGGRLAVGAAAQHVITAVFELDTLTDTTAAPVSHPAPTLNAADRHRTAVALLTAARSLLTDVTPAVTLDLLTSTRTLVEIDQALLLLLRPTPGGTATPGDPHGRHPAAI